MERKRRNRATGSRVLGCALASAMTFASSLPALAAEPVTVFDLSSKPVVQLDKLSPPLTEGLRAILAMYALQSGAGCGKTAADKTQECALNTALKVGPQCSDAQMQLVRAWFKSVPQMSAEQTDRNKYIDIQPPGSLKKLCLSTPDDGEGNAQIWTNIKVTQDGGKILVDAAGQAVAGEDQVFRFRYKTEYEIAGHSILALSHDVQVHQTSLAY